MTTELRTPIEIQKQFITHACLNFTKVIYIIRNNFFIRHKVGVEVMFLAHMKLIILSPTHIAVLFALVCKLSSLLCKGHFYYKFHENNIDIRMLP